MRGLFTDLLAALLAVSGLMSPAVMAGDDIQCDPVEMAKLVMPDGDYSLAIFETTAVIGVPQRNIAYISEQQANGDWLLSENLNGSYFNFGQAVDISGTTVLVGASGSVYVFKKQQDGDWLMTATLTASDSGHSFGCSVALSGTTALIGAYKDDGTGDDSGSAYVFEQQDDETWLEIAKLTASDADHWERFGCSVDISGNIALVGAYRGNGNGIDSGSAYIFEQQEDGTWLETTKLTASDGEVNDNFAWSVAISGTTILIGAFSADNNDGVNTGSSYIFERQEDDTWLESAKILAPDGEAYDYFAWSVDISDTIALIGS
ncbi:MAG: hypothetical protein CMJ29_10790, partial [Phycisphaerae bacterium]|nr:hypothetical protein [Phycisphaerae bacterium]